MTTITISNLRGNLSSYLDKVKTTKKPIVFWSRYKKEFLITPYPNIQDDIDLFDYNQVLEDKVITKEYYEWIQNNMSDWFLEENDDLFE
jgi:hypothetical protein